MQCPRVSGFDSLKREGSGRFEVEVVSRMRQRWAKGFQSSVKGLLLVAFVGLLAVAPAWATEFHGQVVFGGLPVPGAQATVTATQGDKTVTAITDDQGLFAFPDLTDGAWTITITLTGFAPIKEPITVAPNSPIPVFELKLQTLAQIRDETKPVKVEAGTTPLVASTAADTAVANAGGGAASDNNTQDKTAGGKNAADKNAKGQTQQANNAPPNAPAASPAQEASAPDGFLINGSVNNAATSQFSLNQAFGNARNNHSLYNYGLSLRFDSSTLDAKNYSINGSQQAKPSFNNFTAGVQFQGPLKIPHLLPAFRAPTFYIGYNRTQNATVNTGQGTVPIGFTPNQPYNLSNIATLTGQTVYAPATGLRAGCTATPGTPFANNIIPASCISPVATALLSRFYPAPNFTSTTYNYEIPLSVDQHQDAMQMRLQKQFGNKNNVNGTYAIQSTRQSNPNLFGFVDTQDNLGQNVNTGWYHRFTQRVSANFTYQFNRLRNDTTLPFSRSNQNVSQQVGISGNDQNEQANFGPPRLSFSQSQISGLSDGTSRNDRNQTQSLSVNFQWNRFRHEMQMGGDFRRQQFNYFEQSNPRGTLSFTGAATAPPGATGGGSDFADFLLGLPDSSQIAYGNADKYLRQSVYDLFFNDNFRVSPELSITYTLRWEYGAPITETKNRLVNLDFAPNFGAVTPVLATNPVGAQSGQHYPNSLMRPVKNGFAPIAAIAWRPISGSSLLVRAGYGLYHDTSVYQQTALAMANQSPGPGAPWSSFSLSIPRTAQCTILLPTPFDTSNCATTTTPDTFAVDPNFRVGYAQAWNFSIQRDLPAAMQMVATYSGIKGTRGVQELLPNTYPIGGTAPSCVAPCVGYYFRTSNGNSTREAGTLQLRRRLRAGFQANATYTFSKSLDDDYSYGGANNVAGGTNTGGSPQVAQDWTHPERQRGLSTFDQRHVLALQLQYTTGMGLGGHALMSGWRGALYKEWTVLTNISLASGEPETPISYALVPGTAYTNIIRANYSGGAVHQLGATASGIRTYLNQGAFSSPTAGWGTASRGFITGPNQFGLNASMQRNFRVHDRYNLSAQIDANNVLNHATISQWNTTVPAPGSTNSQFGTVSSVNGMRSLSITLRMRY